MQIIIDIHEKDYHSVMYSNHVPYGVVYAIKNGTPLPKRHGRIIDESKITSFYYHEETAKQGAIIHNWNVIDRTDAPTIVEATDKSEV